MENIVKNKYKAILILLISIMVPLGVEKFIYPQASFSIYRAVIIFMLLIFLGIHFIFDVKKLWDFIYHKRYIVGILLFIFLVFNGFHGSSVSLYNEYIQPNRQVENCSSIIGKARQIRSDEFGVGTPFTLSQAAKANRFSETNHNLMAQDKSVAFYSRYPSIGLATLAVPQQIFFFFLPIAQAFSAYWYFPMFFLFFATFEFLMLVTKQNRLWSMVGAFMVTFAPATQWWTSFLIIGSGEAAMLGFNAYLKTDNKLHKLLYTILIGLFGSMYIMNIYPAWLVPYGYFFLLMVIWIIYINRDKVKVRDIVFVFAGAIMVIGLILGPAFIKGKEIYTLISQTVYPGARISTGGNGYVFSINYFSNLFLPYKGTINPSELSEFISFYPLPTIMGLIYIGRGLIKKEKKDFLLIGLVVLSILLSIWNFVQIPEFIAKITLLSLSTVFRSSVVLTFVNLIILIICLANYSQDKIGNKWMLGFGLLIAVWFVYSSVMWLATLYRMYYIKPVIYLTIIIFICLFAMVIINNTKLNKLLALTLIAMSILSGATVHPLNKGLNVIYDKPVTKKVYRILEKDPKARWLTVGSPIYVPNYIAATGAYMINSTNYYPNFQLWQDLGLNNKENEQFYNRYAHILVTLTKKDTKLRLIQDDYLELKMTATKLKNIRVKYVVSMAALEKYSNEEVKLVNIYQEDGMYIYQVKYT